MQLFRQRLLQGKIIIRRPRPNSNRAVIAAGRSREERRRIWTRRSLQSSNWLLDLAHVRTAAGTRTSTLQSSRTSPRSSSTTSCPNTPSLFTRFVFGFTCEMTTQSRTAEDQLVEDLFLGASSDDTSLLQGPTYEHSFYVLYIHGSTSPLNNYIVIVPRECMKIEDLRALVRLKRMNRDRESLDGSSEWTTLQRLASYYGKEQLDYIQVSFAFRSFTSFTSCRRANCLLLRLTTEATA